MTPRTTIVPRLAAPALVAALGLAACGDSTGPDPGPDLGFEVVGRGVVADRFTSDLWVAGDWAYTGTWGARGEGEVVAFGDALNVWDISDPTAPRLTATLTVDARTVNDVKVSADGALAVLTHEGSADGLDGVTLLDLADPGQPAILARYTDGLETGVHNVWIDGDYLYIAVDGVGQGLRILDIGDPSAPVQVASYYAGQSLLHDVYVRDGLAFLSHWNAGLVILDVGNGVAGGAPTDPVEVASIPLDGQTHNAWYWPAAGYVFVGEEDFAAPGRIHVVDVAELDSPREVATFTVPGAVEPPHNFWLDEDRAILYAAWYGHGVRAIDVSGELAGALEQQGRELGFSTYEGTPPGGCTGTGATCTWAPQLAGGLLFVSDMNHGLVVLDPEPR